MSAIFGKDSKMTKQLQFQKSHRELVDKHWAKRLGAVVQVFDRTKCNELQAAKASTT